MKSEHTFKQFAVAEEVPQELNRRSKPHGQACRQRPQGPMTILQLTFAHSPQIAGLIKEKFEIKVVSDSSVNELMRGIRSQIDSLLPGLLHTCWYSTSCYDDQTILVRVTETRL